MNLIESLSGKGEGTLEIKTFINREDGILAEIAVEQRVQRLHKEDTLINESELAYASYSVCGSLVCFIFTLPYGLANVVIYDTNKETIVSNMALRNAIAGALYKDKLIVLATEDGDGAVDAFYYIISLVEDENGYIITGRLDQFYLGVKLAPEYDKASCQIDIQDGIIMCQDFPDVSLDGRYNTPNVWHYDRMLNGDRYPEKDSIYMCHVIGGLDESFVFRRNCFFRNPDYAAGAIKHIIMPEFIGKLKEREYKSELNEFRDNTIIGECELQKQCINEKIDEVIEACDAVFNSTKRKEKVQFIKVAAEKYNYLMQFADAGESNVSIFNGIDDFIKNSRTSLGDDEEFMDICKKDVWSEEDKIALSEMLGYGEFGIN